MADCSEEKFVSTRDTRTFLIHRSTSSQCGWAERRTRCQFVEQDGIERTIRGDITEQYTWEMNADDRCVIGEIEDTPATVTGTLRLKERCAKGQIPFADTLGRCLLYSVTNVGPCEKGNGILNWSGYQKIACLQLVSQVTGKISSYDGSDEPLEHEFSARQLQLQTISTVNWAELEIEDTLCTSGDIQFCEAVFGCKRGCGESKCGCVTACDDGTGTIYVPSVCVGSNFQQVSASIDGGANFKTSYLPIAEFDTNSDGTNDLVPAVSTCPKICVEIDKAFILGNQNPPVLYQTKIDSYGNLGSWTTVGALGLTDTTGTPADICCDGGIVHALVQDAANGARLYRYGGGSSVAAPIRTFPVAADMSGMYCCQDIIYVYGANGSLEVSFDGGNSWSSIVVEDSVQLARITGFDNQQGYLKLITDAGEMWYSRDDGLTWSNVNVGSTSLSHISINGGTGWLSGAGGAPYSTWILGGLSADWWTREEPRQKAWPPTYTPIHTDIPECAEHWLVDNAVLAVATDAGGDPHLMLGKPQVA